MSDHDEAARVAQWANAWLSEYRRGWRLMPSRDFENLASAWFTISEPRRREISREISNGHRDTRFLNAKMVAEKYAQNSPRTEPPAAPDVVANPPTQTE